LGDIISAAGGRVTVALGDGHRWLPAASAGRTWRIAYLPHFTHCACHATPLPTTELPAHLRAAARRAGGYHLPLSGATLPFLQHRAPSSFVERRRARHIMTFLAFCLRIADSMALGRCICRLHAGRSPLLYLSSTFGVKYHGSYQQRYLART